MASTLDLGEYTDLLHLCLPIPELYQAETNVEGNLYLFQEVLADPASESQLMFRRMKPGFKNGSVSAKWKTLFVLKLF